MAAQSGGSSCLDAAAVPLADGGADDRAEEVCQTGGTAGIYGMIFDHRVFVQNREIFRLPPCICRYDGVPMPKTVPAMVLRSYMP